MPTSILIAVSLFAGLSVPAAAQQRQPFGAREVQTSVAYADLNLAMPRDVARLQRRIAIAIDDICGRNPVESAEARDFAHCRTVARASIETRLAALLPRNAQLAMRSR